MSICPIFTKDFEKEPKPCYDGCAWKVKGYCAINVIAQALYHQEKRTEKCKCPDEKK